MSQTQVASAVGKSELQARRFFKQKQLEASPDKDFKSVKISIINESSERGGRGQINGITLDAANDFWIDQLLFG